MHVTACLIFLVEDTLYCDKLFMSFYCHKFTNHGILYVVTDPTPSHPFPPPQLPTSLTLRLDLDSTPSTKRIN